jgi:hypothetical protein
VSEVEVQPLTDDQVAAIKGLRFVWTNMNHTIAWGLTTDESVAVRCPGGMTRVRKSRNPDVTEFDVMMAHPKAVELVVEIQDRLPPERRHQIGVAGALTP